MLHLLKLTLFLLGREIQVLVHLGIIFFTVFLKLLFLFLQDTRVNCENLNRVAVFFNLA